MLDLERQTGFAMATLATLLSFRAAAPAAGAASIYYYYSIASAGPV